MAMLRSAIGIALRQTAPASRFFTSAARRSAGCSDAISALRRPALTSSFFSSRGRGSSGSRKRMMSSYGNSGRAFWNQGSSWERSDILFFGITATVAYVVQSKVRTLQEETWQCRIKDIEVRPYMMDKEKEDVNIPFH